MVPIVGNYRTNTHIFPLRRHNYTRQNENLVYNSRDPTTRSPLPKTVSSSSVGSQGPGPVPGVLAKAQVEGDRLPNQPPVLARAETVADGGARASTTAAVAVVVILTMVVVVSVAVVVAVCGRCG